MPAKSPKVSRYCRQKEKGRPDRAYVMIDGRRIALGRYGSPESYQLYAQAINERPEKPAPEPAPSAPTVSVLIAGHLEYLIEKHRGEKAGEVIHCRQVFKILRQTYGDTLAREFGPKAYQVVRRAMIDKGWSRSYISDQCQRIKRLVAWGVAEELLPPGARHALDAVRPLSLGEYNVRETEEVKPVPDAIIEATCRKLSDVVRDMVRIMRLTGMRAGELCQLSDHHLDRSGEVWTFSPPRHKTRRHGKKRIIAIGPKAQAILAKYLFRDPCFQYTTCSFRRAIHRACDRAFPHPTIRPSKKLPPAERRELSQWQSAHRWSPNQIRHTAATSIREQFGLEFAQVCLGHSRADVTQLYAEANQGKSREVALQIG